MLGIASADMKPRGVHFSPESAVASPAILDCELSPTPEVLQAEDRPSPATEQQLLGVGNRSSPPGMGQQLPANEQQAVA